MSTYTLYHDEASGATGVHTEDGVYIPQDVRNPRWREFLAWNEEQDDPIVLTAEAGQ